MKKLSSNRSVIPLFLSITFMSSPNILAASSKKASFSLPENYESLDACDKQTILWDQVELTKHSKLPAYEKLGIKAFYGMITQGVFSKIDTVSDISPPGWKKHLHKRGAIAKVRIVPEIGQKYSGLFKGADCALLRLSLTYKPTHKNGKGVAPGLALKVLRNATSSANVSALYKLTGQNQEYNFFTHALSNIVPKGSGLGPYLMHSLFKTVSKYPEEVGVTDMAMTDQNGVKASEFYSPKQIFFVPNPKLKKLFSSDKHEIREDFLSIKKDYPLYSIYAVPKKFRNFDYSDYSMDKMKEFLKEAELVGKIMTTSNFVTSEFGDSGVFFKHQATDQENSSK